MDARRQAAELLIRLGRTRGTAKEAWAGPRPAAETALVYGVLRRRGTLDSILQAHSTRRIVALKPETLACLRTGLYELLFLDSPTHAVVHAAVESLRALGRHNDCGFVNAVLRAVGRRVARVEPEAASDARRSLPLDGCCLLFRKSVFPDPRTDPAGFLAARGSTARWIAARRLEELGPERALACLDLQARTPSTHLRVAAGRRAAVEAALTERGIPHEPGPRPELLTLPPQVRVGEVFECCGESVVVQDAVAVRVAPFLLAAPKSRILDACAAPGGKTTHLAEIVGPEGSIVACDVSQARLARVSENASRLGLENIETRLLPADLGTGYDGALVDAPCSNTGVLARRPEARWRVKERHLAGMAERQLKILRNAAACVRPGGAVVYSTCSLEPEENLGVVKTFLGRDGRFRLEEAVTVYPDEGAGDGGFMARMRRV